MKGRPRDPIQFAKVIGDIATGQAEDSVSEKERKPTAKGRVGGLRGGKRRAAALTPKQRHDIARLAAEARWKK